MPGSFFRYIFYLLLVIASPAALAHAEHVHGNAFVTGFTHPVLGLDHLLAMVAVGLVSAVIGGKAIWQVPLAFVLAMVTGGLLGGYGVELPGVELGISASVIALGAVLAIGRPVPYALTLGFVGLFGVMHGHAHGTEMPAMTDPLLYGAGFVSGTASLHLLGVGLGLLSTRIPKGTEVLRLTGLTGCAVGVFLLGNLFV